MPRARKRLKAPERKRQILEVATRLFAEYGYRGTTTAQLAEAAGVTEPILYRHFRSKEDLFLAILDGVSHRVIAEWEGGVDGIDRPLDRLIWISEHFPDTMRRHYAEQRVIYRALAEAREAKVRAILRRHYERYERFLAKLIRDARRDGGVRKDVDPKLAAWLFIGQGIAFGITFPLGIATLARADYAKRSVAAILDSIRV